LVWLDIVTLFPDMVERPLRESIIGRAAARGLIRVRVVGLRRFGVGPHRVTDDYPYGGGGGMVLRPEPVVDAVEWAVAHVPAPPLVLVTAAQGIPLTQSHLEQWAVRPYVVIVAGHYEGIDQRVVTVLNAVEVSIGPYVLTGGELPALVIADGVARLLPGVLGAPEGARQDSFSGPGRGPEGPQYTRPPVYRGLPVPPVLRSGDPAAVRAWRAAYRDGTDRSAGR
jgi:tRNA (guanine37-N1)-methyltransferase